MDVRVHCRATFITCSDGADEEAPVVRRRSQSAPARARLGGGAKEEVRFEDRYLEHLTQKMNGDLPPMAPAKTQAVTYDALPTYAAEPLGGRADKVFQRSSTTLDSFRSVTTDWFDPAAFQVSTHGSMPPYLDGRTQESLPAVGPEEGFPALCRALIQDPFIGFSQDSLPSVAEHRAQTFEVFTQDSLACLVEDDDSDSDEGGTADPSLSPRDTYDLAWEASSQLHFSAGGQPAPAPAAAAPPAPHPEKCAQARWGAGGGALRGPAGGGGAAAADLVAPRPALLSAR